MPFHDQTLMASDFRIYLIGGQSVFGKRNPPSIRVTPFRVKIAADMSQNHF